ncbi:MAG: S-formylglutathione hydrolase [Hyphomicrobiales bacterium]|nr:MAG: S-formylglutathione hydrolase [Hyphomicrobiales bacterium]
MSNDNNSPIELLEERHSHGGLQQVYSHFSEACQCKMTFAIFLPPQAKTGNCPTLTYLSGLTCSHANVMEKGEYRAAAAEHGIIIVCPDTSPRGDDVADEEVYYFGTGAGFYLNATQAPYAANYQMERYITDELPKLISQHFAVSDSKESIFGHSMGGHGAMTLALKNPGRYKSVSAFAPIATPNQSEWGRNAFTKFLGADEKVWRTVDTVSLLEDGATLPDTLVDQGLDDEFLPNLNPEALEAACAKAGVNLTLRRHEGYDHSYYFISTFMADHIGWHAKRLNG